MTPEEKELLLKDLSARIPYQPLCKKIDTEDDFCESDVPLGYSLRDFVGNKVIIKPYLRPMSSMTEEEKKEFQACHCVYELHPDFQPMMCNLANELNMFDWLNAHHFDVRNLIGRGLAIDCTNLNIY